MPGWERCPATVQKAYPKKPLERCSSKDEEGKILWECQIFCLPNHYEQSSSANKKVWGLHSGPFFPGLWLTKKRKDRYGDESEVFFRWWLPVQLAFVKHHHTSKGTETPSSTLRQNPFVWPTASFRVGARRGKGERESTKSFFSFFGGKQLRVTRSMPYFCYVEDAMVLLARKKSAISDPFRHIWVGGPENNFRACKKKTFCSVL